MQRVTVLYSGRVHGVGFRATVRHVARGYDVAGTVRNLSDGRVELIAEGTKAELVAFLEGIAMSELSSYITQRPETWSAAQGGMRGFVIAH
jgi:acylphosphatase